MGHMGSHTHYSDTTNSSHDCDRIVVGIYTNASCECYSHSLQCTLDTTLTGADPGFQARGGGGGGALQKNAPCGGRRENIWGILCEKSRFYAKKSYFFQF